MTLVYIDTETTGLNPDVHDVIEVAWAVDDGSIDIGFFDHTLRNADPVALKINGYFERRLDTAYKSTTLASDLLRDLRGATLVGSNPSFDANFLRKKLGVDVWHHRMIDVTTCAMWEFGWDRPKGLFDVVAALNDNGYQIAAPDHSAEADVIATRAAYLALIELRLARS